MMYASISTCAPIASDLIRLIWAPVSMRNFVSFFFRSSELIMTVGGFRLFVIPSDIVAFFIVTVFLSSDLTTSALAICFASRCPAKLHLSFFVPFLLLFLRVPEDFRYSFSATFVRCYRVFDRANCREIWAASNCVVYRLDYPVSYWGVYRIDCFVCSNSGIDLFAGSCFVSLVAYCGDSFGNHSVSFAVLLSNYFDNCRVCFVVCTRSCFYNRFGNSVHFDIYRMSCFCSYRVCSVMRSQIYDY